MPKMQMCSLKKCHFAMRVFDEMWLCTMKDHMKCGFLQEKSTNLAFPCESYGTLNLGIFWKWLDHILPTTHGNFKFLDFLEWWDQDLQLSCWTKFHLKLVWWSNFEEKNFPFWAAEITGHLLFLETSDLTSNSSTLVFGMSNETCMDMNEAFQTISHLQIHKIRHSWPQLTF